jgi:hypothetical protein
MPPPTLNSTRVAPAGQPPVARVSSVPAMTRKEKALATLAANSAQAAQLPKLAAAIDVNDSSKSKSQDTRRKRYEAARYFVFVLLFCVSAFIHLNVQLFWFRNAISSVFMSKDVDAVVGPESFWNFASNSEAGSFLSNFFASIHRFGTSSNSSLSIASSVFLISPLRIRTLRVIPGSCFPEGFNSANISQLFGASKSCHPLFNLEAEMKTDYGAGHTFSWSDDPTVVSRHLIGDFGELAHYPGGGYAVDVPTNNARDAGLFLRKLQNSAFLDGNSSYVALEFNLFAPLAMTYLPARIYFEFPPIGGAIMGTQLSTTKMFRYDSAEGQIIQGIDALLIVYFILSSLSMAKDFWGHGFMVFLKQSGWNAFDFVSNLSLMVNLGLRFNMHREAQALHLADPTKFTEISQFLVFERSITAANAFTLLLVLVRVCFYYGSYVPKATLIISACQYALPNLIVCTGVLLATFIAFTASFYACFGAEVAAYRTFGLACLAMLKALMGNTDDMITIPSSGFPIIGPILIGTFSLTMYFILVNFFAAIMVDAFATTKSVWRQQEKQLLLQKHSAQQKTVGKLKQKFEDDLSGDDVIDREELEAIVSNYKDLLGFDSVEEFLKRYDDNGDGVITRAELAPVLNKLDSDLEAMKSEGASLRGALTSDGIVELFETFDQSMDDKFSSYTESLMRMIEQRSFGAGNSAAMGMGFEGGQGVIPMQPNRSRDMLSQDNLVTSLIGTVKAKSQFLTIKKRHAASFHFFPPPPTPPLSNPLSRFDQKKLGNTSPDSSPTKNSSFKNHQRQRQQSDDDVDMEATLGPQHGKFEAKAPEIEELKLRVEALQAQVGRRSKLRAAVAAAIM